MPNHTADNDSTLPVPMNELVQSPVETPNTDKMQADLLHYISLGYNWKEAGLKAGYSEASSKWHVSRMARESPTFREKLANIAKATRDVTGDIATVEWSPKVYNAYDKALDAYQNDPKLTIERPKALETAAKIVGLIKPDVGQSGQTVVQVNVISGQLRAEYDSIDVD